MFAKNVSWKNIDFKSKYYVLHMSDDGQTNKPFCISDVVNKDAITSCSHSRNGTLPRQY